MVMPMRIRATDIGVMVSLISLGILIATLIVACLSSLSCYKHSVLTYCSGSVIRYYKDR